MRQLPFPAAWVGFDLGEFRCCDSTYECYDYWTIPWLPEDLFDGTLHWLKMDSNCATASPAARWTTGDVQAWNERGRRVLPMLQEAVERAGFVLPPAFERFLTNGDLVSRFRSPTDCYFRHSATLLDDRDSNEGAFLHFLSDSQNCYEWYLHLDREGNHCVVVSDEDLADFSSTEISAIKPPDVMCCAPSFESFLYRLWLENEIWLRLVDESPPLTDSMQEYLRLSAQTEAI